MTTKPALWNIVKGILKLRKKTKPSMKQRERIDHTRLIVKQDKKKIKHYKINKMAGTNAHLSTITKSSGLNVPKDMEDWIKKHEPSICCLQETYLTTKAKHNKIHYLRMKDEKLFQVKKTRKQEVLMFQH